MAPKINCCFPKKNKKMKIKNDNCKFAFTETADYKYKKINKYPLKY